MVRIRNTEFALAHVLSDLHNVEVLGAGLWVFNPGRLMRPKLPWSPNGSGEHAAVGSRQAEESHGDALTASCAREHEGHCLLSLPGSLSLGKLDEQLLGLNLDARDVSLDDFSVVSGRLQFEMLPN
jgi:hypothetical protein